LTGLIHRSAWNRNSTKFTVAISLARVGLRGSGWGEALFTQPHGSIILRRVA
jgi:hypothetical protein